MEKRHRERQRGRERRKEGGGREREREGWRGSYQDHYYSTKTCDNPRVSPMTRPSMAAALRGLRREKK